MSNHRNPARALLKKLITEHSPMMTLLSGVRCCMFCGEDQPPQTRRERHKKTCPWRIAQRYVSDSITLSKLYDYVEEE